ncbi:MAG: hypothetical protein CMN76_15975 [Spirochaetaceae bacterium]|nr:hypothetical protein [Spirochaetaceae bacterium]|tara:strand:+ start:42251 stop:43051 length:801 start_codon:yes stop_codon:yes gene_type:complete
MYTWWLPCLSYTTKKLAKPGGIVQRPTHMRYSNTKARNVFLALSLVTAITIVWSAPSDEPDLSEADLAAQSLFGMDSGNSNRNSNPVQRSNEPGNSLFDSGFMESGVGDSDLPDRPEARQRQYGDPEILDPVSEGNPINPQTGQPFTDRQMSQFNALREKFPDNSVIPQRMTPELKAQKEQRRQEIYKIQTRIVKKEASETEVNEYYDYQQKSLEDRMELIEYVLNNPNTDMSDEMRKKFEEVKQMNQRTLKSYEDARKRALNSLN